MLPPIENPDAGETAFLSSVYGGLAGFAILSATARLGWLSFYYRRAYEGSVTLVDALGYPKHQDIYWYVLSVVLVVVFALIYGVAARARLVCAGRSLHISFLIFAISAPLLLIESLPSVAIIAHVFVVAVAPFVLGLILNREETPTEGDVLYEPWVLGPIFLLFSVMVLWLFAFFHFGAGGKWWLVAGWVPFVLISAAICMSGWIRGRYSGNSVGTSLHRIVWALLPSVLLCLMAFFWWTVWVKYVLLVIAVLLGALLYRFPPKRSATTLVYLFVPLSLGAIFQYSPLMGFNEIDTAHEGFQLASTQAILGGLLPGVAKAVKYGPLFELTEAWALKIFGVQVLVLRGYFQLAQVLSFLIGCIVISGLLRRRSFVIWGWLIFWLWSTLVEWSPGRFNDLRCCLPLLAIYLWFRWCRDGGVWRVLFAGALVSVGVFYSVEFGVAGAAALMVGLIVLLVSEKSRWRGIGAPVIALAAGVLAVLLIMAIVYRGDFGRLLVGMYKYANAFRQGHGAFPYPSFPWLDSDGVRYLGTGYFINRMCFYFPPLVIVSVGIWLMGNLLAGGWSREHVGIAALLVFAGLSWRLALGRSDIHHVLKASAPAAILCVFLAERLWEKTLTVKASLGKRSMFVIVTGATAAVVLLMPVLLRSKGGMVAIDRIAQHHQYHNIQDAREAFSKEGYRPTYLNRLKDIWLPWYQAESYEILFEFITNNTARDERIHIAPYHGVLFFVADRLPATRYIMPADAVTPQTKAAILETLKKNPPGWVLMNPSFHTNFSYRMEHPEEVQYIERKYEIIGNIRGLNIYRKKIGQDDEN